MLCKTSKMSPRAAPAAVRSALITTAARVISEQGAAALTLRGVVAAVGTSTMAVYTHFGGMEELRRAVRAEAFAGLARRLDQVTSTRDPVADLAAMGWAYYEYAVENPHLYRNMFMEAPIDDVDLTVGLDTFTRLVEGVQGCIDAGRFHDDDPFRYAAQLWALTHGIVALRLAALLDHDQAVACLADAGGNLFVGLGDTRTRVKRSIAAGRRRAGLA
jgi:AcrR family transcriptional regulator